MPSPTARTLALLKRSGYVVAVVEKWIPRINRRKDLWFIGDVLAIDTREPGLLLIQCTSLAHVGDRLAKAKGRPELAAWLRCPGTRFAVWGWFKRAGRWRVKVVAVRGEDLELAALIQPPRRKGRRPRQPDLFDRG